MAVTKATRVYIETRRDREVAMFFDLKMKGEYVERILPYLALKFEVGVETVKRDLRLRGAIGVKAMRKIEDMTREKYRIKNRNRHRNRRKTKSDEKSNFKESHPYKL